MAGLSQQLMDEMRQRAQAVRQKLTGSGGGDWLPRWDLVGKNAIVQPGREVMIRLLPRWDFAQKFLAGGKINPAYKNGRIFVEAREHWWTAPDGRRHREWCPTMFGANEPCPICEAWLELRTSKAAADKELAKDLKPTDVYLFNAILGPSNSRVLGDNGLVDIRYMPAPGTVFVGIIDIMTGGETGGDFACGDISDPKEGYDLKFTRPASSGGDRWKVHAAQKASTLFTAPQQPAFAKWWERIVDLQAMVEKEMKSYDDLYTAFHGSAPSASDGVAAPAAEEQEASNDSFPEAGAPPEEPGPFAGMGGGDIEMPGAPTTAPAARQGPQGVRRPAGRR